MEERKRNLLTDHLDATMQGNAVPEAEELLRQQAEAREEWVWQQQAVEAVRHEGLVQQVAAVKEQYLAETSKARVFPLKRPLQVAAAIFLVLGAVAVFKYYSVNAGSFFRDHYETYELPVSRGEAAESQNALVQAYGQKKWNEVTLLYQQTPVKNNQWNFLAGIAEMELGRYAEAIQKLELVLNDARNTGNDQFRDEAEYYLAMALLASDRTEEALAIFEKIKADPDHLYAAKVEDLSGADLKILEFKTGKQRK